MVNNAGVVGQVGEVEELTMSQWQQVFEINLLGVIRGCKVFNPLFKQKKVVLWLILLLWQVLPMHRKWGFIIVVKRG